MSPAAPHYRCSQQISAEELSGLTVRELRSRAVEAGVSKDAIEDARDGDQPKEDLIALIVAAAQKAVMQP